MAELEAMLGYRFRRPELLQQALTHSSFAHEGGQRVQPAISGARPDNELLEFLGDSILGMVTSEALFATFPERGEGELSKLRAHLVSTRHLVRVAKEINLGDFLRLGRGEELSGGRAKTALLVDALEAVLAAMHLDGGSEAARNFVLRRVVEPELEQLKGAGDEEFAVTDFKSALQESVQALGRPQPAYSVAKESGPDHKKIFTVELRLQEANGARSADYVARAEGPSKKIAEQRAAKLALEHLQGAAQITGSRL